MDRRKFLFWTVTSTGALAGKRVFASPETLTDEEMAEIVYNHPDTVDCHLLNIGKGRRRSHCAPLRHLDGEYSWHSTRVKKHPVDHIFTTKDRSPRWDLIQRPQRTFRRRKYREGAKVIVRITGDEDDQLTTQCLDLSDPHVKMLSLRGDSPRYFGRIEGQWAELS
jgi:hypothetical protein